MSEKKSMIKVNKNHGGKEFKNYFRFIGKVKPVKKKIDDNWVDQPYLNQTKTQTGKPRKVLQFILETAKSNELKLENAGMEFETAVLYSSTDKKSVKIPWADRHNKEKYPNDTYHLLTPDWDLTEELSQKLATGQWVEVKGYYQPETFAGDDGVERKTIKRIVTSVEPVTDGQEIKLNGETFNYVTDFDSPDFKEVNTFTLQLGIISTYQNEENKNTKVNAVILTNGKERSIPKELELTVYYKEGKAPLADAFARLNRLDFLEVTGTDNNRAEFTYVEIEDIEEDNPFADVEEKTVRKERVTAGSRKGLEILTFVQGTYMKELLTEEEITKLEPVVKVETKNGDNPFTIEEEDLPF